MRVGDRGYADPNALAPLRDGTCFLLGTFALHAGPDAVARMLIERIIGGWVVARERGDELRTGASAGDCRGRASPRAT